MQKFKPENVQKNNLGEKFQKFFIYKSFGFWGKIFGTLGKNSDWVAKSAYRHSTWPKNHFNWVIWLFTNNYFSSFLEFWTSFDCFSNFFTKFFYKNFIILFPSDNFLSSLTCATCGRSASRRAPQLRYCGPLIHFPHLHGLRSQKVLGSSFFDINSVVCAFHICVMSLAFLDSEKPNCFANCSIYKELVAHNS